MKAINARPIKKIAEAKARKKLRAQKQWAKIRRTATGIAESSLVSERSKIKQIQALYAKANRNQKKPDKVLMVTTHRNKKPKPTGKKAPKNAPRVVVDKRLKADKRGIQKVKRKMKAGVSLKSKKQRNNKNARRNR